MRSPYSDDPILGQLRIFPSESALAALPSTRFVARALSSIDDGLYRWDPASIFPATVGAVIVPSDIAASPAYLAVPSSAPGRHVSVLGLNASVSGANQQPEWYIDAALGSDSATGMAGDPLATLTEFLRRLGDQPIDGNDAGLIAFNGVGIVFVYLAGDQPDPVTIDVRFANDGGLAFVGTRTVAVASTIATSTPWITTTGVIGSYSITGISNITSHVGKMVRINAGPRQGFKGPIAKSLGSGVFRTSWSDPSDGSAIEPVVADGVDIYTVNKIGGDVRITCGPAGTNGGTIYFQDLELGVSGSDHSVIVAAGQAQFLACIVHGFDVYRAVSYVSITSSLVVECRSYSEVDVMGCTFETVGGTPLSARGGGIVRVSQRCLIQGGGANAGHLTEGPGHLRCAAPLACVDYATAALNVFPGSTATFDDVLTMRDAALGPLGVQVFAGGSVFYASGKPPVIVGTAPTGDYKIGGTAKAKAAVPYLEATNGAVVAVNQ